MVCVFEGRGVVCVVGCVHKCVYANFSVLCLRGVSGACFVCVPAFAPVQESVLLIDHSPTVVLAFHFL